MQGFLLDADTPPARTSPSLRSSERKNYRKLGSGISVTVTKPAKKNKKSIAKQSKSHNTLVFETQDSLKTISKWRASLINRMSDKQHFLPAPLMSLLSSKSPMNLQSLSQLVLLAPSEQDSYEQSMRFIQELLPAQETAVKAIAGVSETQSLFDFLNNQKHGNNQSTTSSNSEVIQEGESTSSPKKTLVSYRVNPQFVKSEIKKERRLLLETTNAPSTKAKRQTKKALQNDLLSVVPQKDQGLQLVAAAAVPTTCNSTANSTPDSKSSMTLHHQSTSQVYLHKIEQPFNIQQQPMQVYQTLPYHLPVAPKYDMPTIMYNHPHHNLQPQQYPQQPPQRFLPMMSHGQQLIHQMSGVPTNGQRYNYHPQYLSPLPPPPPLHLQHQQPMWRVNQNYQECNAYTDSKFNNNRYNFQGEDVPQWFDNQFQHSFEGSIHHQQQPLSGMNFLDQQIDEQQRFHNEFSTHQTHHHFDNTNVYHQSEAYKEMPLVKKLSIEEELLELSKEPACTLAEF